MKPLPSLEALLKSAEFDRKEFRRRFDNVMACPEVDFDEVAAYYANTKITPLITALASALRLAVENMGCYCEDLGYHGSSGPCTKCKAKAEIEAKLQEGVK